MNVQSLTNIEQQGDAVLEEVFEEKTAPHSPVHIAKEVLKRYLDTPVLFWRQYLYARN